MKLGIVNYFLPVISGVIITLFSWGWGIRLFSSDSLSLIANLFFFIFLCCLFWLVYSFIVAKSTKKDIFFVLKQDALSFLPFFVLLLFPLTRLAGLQGKYSSFGNLPATILLIFSFSLFISLKFLFYGNQIRDMKVDSLIYILVFVYFVVFSSLTILKHSSFFSTAYDLGVYDQSMWGLVHGKMPSSIMEVPLLGNHVQPILLLLSPFYYLYQNPITLLLIQTLFISISAIPLYWLAKKVLHNKLSSFIICISYLLYLPLWYANLFDFHPIVLALPFLMFAMYALHMKKYALFIVSMIFVSACKEYLSLLFVPIGFYLFIKHKKRFLGVACVVLGIWWFMLCINVIIPHFYGGGYFFFEGNPAFGGSLGGVAKTFIFNPLTVVKQLFSVNRLAYLLLLFAPIGFGIFSIMAPEFLLLAITEFMIVLLHSQDPLPEIVYHHQISLVPFILVAAVFGIYRFNNVLSKVRLKRINKSNLILSISVFILFTSIFSNMVYGPFSVLYDLNDFDVSTDYVKAGNSLLDLIPEEGSVAAPNWVVPHLSRRDNVFLLNRFLKNTEYIQKQGAPDYIVLDFSDALDDPKRSANKINATDYETVLDNPDYSVVYQQSTWFLLKHN